MKPSSRKPRTRSARCAPIWSSTKAWCIWRWDCPRSSSPPPLRSLESSDGRPTSSNSVRTTASSGPRQTTSGLRRSPTEPDLPLRWRDENALRQRHVDAEVGFVHELRDRDIPRNAHQLISLMAGELFLRHQEIHHLLDGGLGGHHQIRIGSHADVVRGGFRTRPFEPHVFAHGQLQAAAQGGLDGGLIHLAVSLGSIAIAYFE